MTSPTRSRSATRDRLLDATALLLAREGFQGASVEHICEQAGFTRGAFYSNFASKDDLLEALFVREREQMIATLQEVADASFDGLDPQAAAALMMDTFARLRPADRDWFLRHAEFALRGVRHDSIGPDFNEALQLVKEQVERLMESVFASFGLRSTVPISHAATIVMGAYDNAVREALVEDREVDMDLLRVTVPTMLLAVSEPVDS